MSRLSIPTTLLSAPTFIDYRLYAFERGREAGDLSEAVGVRSNYCLYFALNGFDALGMIKARANQQVIANVYALDLRFIADRLDGKQRHAAALRRTEYAASALREAP